MVLAVATLPTSLAATMAIDELEASVFLHTSSSVVCGVSSCVDGSAMTIAPSLASPPPGLEAVLAAQDTDAIPPVVTPVLSLACPLPINLHTQNPSTDAVGAWNVAAAVLREADDHAATLASPRRHKTRALPAPQVGYPHTVASDMVIDVAKLLKPKSAHSRLTTKEVSEHNRRYRENGTAVAKWRCQTPTDPVQLTNGANFSCWIKHHSAQLA